MERRSGTVPIEYRTLFLDGRCVIIALVRSLHTIVIQDHVGVEIESYGA